MNEKEAFEDIIASKFAEAEFPFDEGNWDAVEEMIDKHRAKESRRRFAWIFSAGLALGILFMLPFVLNFNDTAPLPIAENRELEVENTIPLKQQNSEVSNSPLKSVVGKLAKNVDNAQNGEANDAQPASVVISDFVAEKRNKNTESDKLVANEEAPANEKATVLRKQIQLRKNSKPLEEAKVGFEEASVNLPFDGLNFTEKQDFSIRPILLKTMVQEKMALKTLLLSDSFVVLKADSSIAMVNLPASYTDVGNKKIIRPWNATIGMGGNYVNKYSLNPIQGIEFTKAIGAKLGIGTGAYYTYLTIRSGGVKSITTKMEFNFGAESEVSEIKTNKVHYVVIPLYLSVDLNDKNSFVLGANLFTLVTTSNSVTNYKDNDGERKLSSSEKTAGYTKGINDYDVGVLAGYKRNIIGNLGAAIYFNYGLKDILRNDYYNESKFDRNISGQLMLTYKL